MKSTFERIEDVICARFGEGYRGKLSPETTMDDVPEWDSLSFLDLVTDLEQAFNVRFRPNETAQLFKLGLIEKIVTGKQSG